MPERIAARSTKQAPRLSGVALLLAAVAPLLSAGCASCADEECGTGLQKPEFLDATHEEWGRVKALPDTFVNEWDDRTGRVGDGVGRLFAGRGREWDETSDHVAGFGPWLGDEFGGSRVDQFWGFFERQGDRAENDACCFFTRAWHSIKTAIE